MTTVISVENLSKVYRLGQIGTGTLANDLNIWWARTRGKPNPLLKFGGNENGEQEGGNVWALKDVSFTVEQGEVLGIIGRNGAGKSTLLKILSRITAPTSGRVRVKGRIASLLEVGTGFHPELTGRENIYLNGAILGMSRAEIARKFDEIVDFSGVEKFIDTPVKRYSSGMYVRLAFAVAAHLEPEILLVDEVLAVGDAEFQKKCLGKMGEISREGRTVLFVSHNMTAVTNLCTNAMLFINGEINTHGNVEKIISSYFESGVIENIETDFSLKTDEFTLLRLSITQDGNDSKYFVTNKPLLIEYEYVTHEKLNGLRVGFDIILSDGTVIFRSFDNDLLSLPIRERGWYLSKCNIPANFFYPTEYFFIPRIGIHNIKWITNVDKAVRLSFNHTMGVNVDFADRRPGIIMPGLVWSISQQ